MNSDMTGQTCLGCRPSTTYESGTKQNWKDQIPCGLCSSACHEKNRSVTYEKNIILGHIYLQSEHGRSWHFSYL